MFEGIHRYSTSFTNPKFIGLKSEHHKWNSYMAIKVRVISRAFYFFIGIGLLLSQSALSDTLNEVDDHFRQGIEAIKEKGFKNVGKGIDSLIQSQDERVSTVLETLLEGKLYRHKSDNKLVLIKEKKGSKLVIQEFFQKDQEQTVSKRKVKRIGVNNQLRNKIRLALASKNLSDSDPDIRHQALKDMLTKVSPEMRPLLENQLEQETVDNNKDLIEIALSVLDLQSSDEDLSKKLDAIETLSHSVEPIARSTLVQTLSSSTNMDQEMKHSIEKALQKIDDKLELYSIVETLFFGLSLGSILVLASIGLAITFGVMGVINMAHGELIMLGAYTTYMVQWFMPNQIESSIIIAIPLAFLITAFVGILIQQGVVRFLHGRPLETLLATFGLSLILQQFVRVFVSPNNVPVENPSWMSGLWEINSALSITYNRLFIFIFCLIIFALLTIIMKKTRLGLQVRAVSQNRQMAKAMGIKSNLVDAMTFGLGSGIAGIAGVALSQITNVGPNLGTQYIIDSFMVVVFGGVGNLWGTFVAGLSLGMINKAIEPMAGAVLAKIIVLVFIILFIQKRPRGLFPQQGRAVED